MEVPIYILGFLTRYGPQHGYRLKQLIAGVASEFAPIKLPTIYYHLERMQRQGLIISSRDQEGKRPERYVYSITDKGRAGLGEMIQKSLDFRYRPEFRSDAVLLFSEELEEERLVLKLKQYREELEETLVRLEKGRKAALLALDPNRQGLISSIFSRHEHHYRAELAWVNETLAGLSGS